jgi:hypothetical protein
MWQDLGAPAAFIFRIQDDSVDQAAGSPEVSVLATRQHVTSHKTVILKEI